MAKINFSKPGVAPEELASPADSSPAPAAAPATQPVTAPSRRAAAPPAAAAPAAPAPATPRRRAVGPAGESASGKRRAAAPPAAAAPASPVPEPTESVDAVSELEKDSGHVIESDGAGMQEASAEAVQQDLAAAANAQVSAADARVAALEAMVASLSAKLSEKAAQPPAETLLPATVPLPPHLRQPAVTAVATRGAALPSVPSRGSFFDDQNVEFSDIQVPSINLVQRVGELSTMFDFGEIVLDRQLPLPRPVRLVVCGLSAKRFVERVEGEDGQGGNIAYSMEEVVQSGGTISYKDAKEKGLVWYQTLVTALLLIEKHEWITDSDSGAFQFEDSTTGKWYALCRWNLKGTSYTQGAQVLMTARAIGRCRGGYPNEWWDLNTNPNYRTRNGNFVTAPVLRPAGETSPEFRAFLQSCLGFGGSN